MAASPVTPARSCTTPCCPERDSIGVIMPRASAPLMECHVGCRRIAPDGVAGAGSGPGRRYSGCTGRSDRPVGVPAELPPGSCLATKVSCTRMTSPRGCGDVCKICVWAARQRATQFCFLGEKGCIGPAALRLEALVEELACSEAVHPGFRLWLSSMPSPGFPPSVLQAGLKLAVQPPRGVRATLVRTYSAMTNDAFEASPSSLPDAWKHLLLGISFFHATVQVCLLHTWTAEP